MTDNIEYKVIKYPNPNPISLPRILYDVFEKRGDIYIVRGTGLVFEYLHLVLT